jgi:cobalt-precorrin 5A hydrolase
MDIDSNRKMKTTQKSKLAVWAITPNGVDIAKTIAGNFSEVAVFLSEKLPTKGGQSQTFGSLSEILTEQFYRYDSHVFIMATGIVVRMIAPLIQSKVEDPAVVVVDDRGNHAVSLISGHIGGANALAIAIAECIDANPVITTATDVNQIVAIDVLAKQKQLFIENPQAIKTVNMSLLRGEKICLHDPFNFLQGSIPDSIPWSDAVTKRESATEAQDTNVAQRSYVFIDDVLIELPPETLVLRSPTLMVGIGCNRDTAMQEMHELLERVFEQFSLSLNSLAGIASIRLKADETGLLALAKNLDRPLLFYDREELNQVKTIENPSLTVEKHIGVKSVCEAAAILAAHNGTLVVPKQTTRNVTVAIARLAFIS